MKNVIYHILATAVTAAAFTACANEEWEGSAAGKVREGDPITFTTTTADATDGGATRSAASLPVSGYTSELWLNATVEDAPRGLTRGTLLNSGSELASFGVSAYLHGKNEDITAKRPDYFYNKQAVKDGAKYSFAQDYYWPSNDERLSFMAYAPYGSDYVVLADAGAEQPAVGAQQVQFTVATAATDQVDFMTATTMLQSPGTLATPSVALGFEHQLAAVRFIVGDQFPTQGYIQKITLQGVYGSGTYTLTDGATPGSWSYGARANFNVSYTADQKLTGEVGQVITQPAQTFLMIPCAFADDDAAQVVIDFWDGYTLHTVTSPLAGVTWQAGKTYTYELSSQRLTTLQVQSIGFAPTVSGAPRTKWVNGDKVGLYVVHGVKKDGDDPGVSAGRTLRYSNIPVTATVDASDNVTWSVDHTTAQGTVVMYPGDTYYFYYPYAVGGPAGYPNECNEVGATADKFFSSVITAHTVQTDQSAIANFVASDLQVAKAVLPGDDGSNLPASTIKATMARKVGLAVIAFGSDNAKKSVTFTNGVAGTPTTDVVKATSVLATDGLQAFASGTKKYYYAKAGVATSFNSLASEKDAWEAALVFNIAAGASQELTAHSDRKNWDYINAVWNYSYTGAAQAWTPAPEGTYSYTMECWGAQGSALSGSSGGWNSYATTYVGGKGGYTKGTITLSSDKSLYVYVGNNAVVGSQTQWDYGNSDEWMGYSFNGGAYMKNRYGTKCGGGATDIRVKSGDWKDLASLKSRIMVAGGGGSAGDRGQGYGGGSGSYAGGLEGKDGVQDSRSHDRSELNWYGYMGTGGTQINADWFYISKTQSRTKTGVEMPGWLEEMTGVFGGGGLGQDGEGGSGWYGGSGSEHGSGAGGSSYISGHANCRAIKQSATVKTGGESNHESGSVAVIDGVTYTFSGTTMIDGGHSQTKPGGGTETGHSGNGYARITLTRW